MGGPCPLTPANKPTPFCCRRPSHCEFVNSVSAFAPQRFAHRLANDLKLLFAHADAARQFFSDPLGAARGGGGRSGRGSCCRCRRCRIGGGQFLFARQPQAHHRNTVRGRCLPVHGTGAHRRGRHHLHQLAGDAHQVPGVEAGQALQWPNTHRSRLAEAALLHRPRRWHVPSHSELYEKLKTSDCRGLSGPGAAAGGGALLRSGA